MIYHILTQTRACAQNSNKKAEAINKKTDLAAGFFNLTLLILLLQLVRLQQEQLAFQQLVRLLR